MFSFWLTEQPEITGCLDWNTCCPTPFVQQYDSLQCHRLSCPVPLLQLWCRTLWNSNQGISHWQPVQGGGGPSQTAVIQWAGWITLEDHGPYSTSLPCQKANVVYVLVLPGCTFGSDYENDTRHNLLSSRVALSPCSWYWSWGTDLNSSCLHLLLLPWKGQQPAMVTTPSPYDGCHCNGALTYIKCSFGLQPKKLAILRACPKPFTGIEEHCGLVAGRSKLSKSDEK